MKNLKRVIIAIVLCLLVFVIGKSMFKTEVEKHPLGRDTLHKFGDGTYQIFRVSSKPLLNLENQETVENEVFKYYDKDPLAYIVGGKGYTILNYRTWKVKQSKNLEDFSEAEIKIFNATKKFRVVN